jgi:enterochelin esterase family protein
VPDEKGLRILDEYFAFRRSPEGRLASQSEDAPPASTNVPGALSPRVLPDNRVALEFAAPEARSVSVEIAGNRYPLQKRADGIWQVITPPQVPGFRYYQMIVDGLRVNDRGSRAFFGTGIHSSAIEIPEPGVDFHLERNVPHGDVRIRTYFSAVTGRWRRSFIYTPPGYDQDTDRRYPVLYLQHGMGSDETAWVFQGNAHLIMDNLIAEGLAVPMIVVMDNGYSSRPPVGPAPPPTGGAVSDFGAFEEVMLKELIPMVDGSFRTLADRGHRAIAGLSMGAGQALRLGFRHPDTFSYLGGFSGSPNGVTGEALDPATAFDGRFRDAAAFDRDYKLLWLGMGSEEALPHPRTIGAFRNMLDAAGVKYTFYTSPGTAHEWLTWRRDLHQFAPLLFR